MVNDEGWQIMVTLWSTNVAIEMAYVYSWLMRPENGKPWRHHVNICIYKHHVCMCIYRYIYIYIHTHHNRNPPAPHGFQDKVLKEIRRGNFSVYPPVNEYGY